MADSENWIKHRAYELWEADGRPDGKHEEHWNKATAEFHAKQNGTAPSGVKKPAARKKANVKAQPVANDPVIETTPAKTRKSGAPKASAAPLADSGPKKRSRKTSSA